MRVLKNAWFDKFARKALISDTDLCAAVARADRGVVDADLGGGVIKQRIARSGAGRSGGFRALIFFRNGVRSIFVFAFAKSDRANLSSVEGIAFKKAANIVLSLSDEEIDKEVSIGRLMEVRCDG